MSTAINYITAEKKKALELELLDLEGPKRKVILDSLAYAKSLGDLKENAEYHQAREEQGKLEERILKIKEILQSCEVVHAGGGDTVEIGSKVTVQKEDTSGDLAGAGTKTYTIVGSEESNMAEGKISNRSPFGEALYGKKKGDKISFSTPSGVVNYKIINVS